MVSYGDRECYSADDEARWKEKIEEPSMCCLAATAESHFEERFGRWILASGAVDLAAMVTL